MSTSDQPQLTRKELREARLTGSTPIVTPEDAEAARLAAEAEQAADVVAPEPELQAEPEPEPEPEPLTRRQMREQEQIRTASVAVVDETVADTAPEAVPAPLTIPERPAAPEAPAMITDVPRAAYPTRRRSYEPASDADEQDGVDDAEQAVAPVSVFAMMRAQEAASRARLEEPAPDTAEVPAPAAPAAPTEAVRPTAPPVLPAAPAVDEVFTPAPVAASAPPLPFAPDAAPWTEPVADEEPTIESLLGGSDPEPESDDEPTVNAGFGRRVLAQQTNAPVVNSFDALIGDSTGSHHAAPNALIFQQAPSGPSLSGPVASTGEILVTGSYDLPAGLGSRGHADGFADGKEVDAVLVDGELAPASSPTPIAASAAIGTIKPAGEVIRPPEPEKSNKLMLALTITAGVLAVALVGALIVAITTGALS
ncbi:hypothetical protein [Microbacterium panaciterrae]|uniref:Uncharacterized protein n=1 Tax=Microbacterium panaciterrae TaxID=985759 RepID=A0ABP8PK18_9MICO